MVTVTLLLLVGAFVICVWSSTGKVPLWPAVLLVIVERALAVLQ